MKEQTQAVRDFLHGSKHPKKTETIEAIRGMVDRPKYSLAGKKNITRDQFLKQSKGVKLSRFYDYDGDKYINSNDCFPFDPTRHGVWTKAKNWTQGKGFQEDEDVEAEQKAFKESQGIIPSEEKTQFKDVKEQKAYQKKEEKLKEMQEKLQKLKMQEQAIKLYRRKEKVNQFKRKRTRQEISSLFPNLVKKQQQGKSQQVKQPTENPLLNFMVTPKKQTEKKKGFTFL